MELSEKRQRGILKVKKSNQKNKVNKKKSKTVNQDNHSLKKTPPLSYEAEKTNLEVLQHCSDLGIWKWNLISNEVEFDKRWCEIIGYKQKELIPHFSTFKKLMHPQDLLKVEDKVTKYIQGSEQRFEVFFKLKHKKGHWVDILSKGKVFHSDKGIPQLFCGTHFDMSYVKQIEEKAEDVSKLSEEIQRMGKIGGWEFDVIKNELYWTDETYYIHGLEAGAKFNLDDGIGFYIKKDQPRILKCIQECKENKKSFLGDFQLRLSGDKKKWVRSYGEAICDEEGRVYKLRGTFQDITNIKNLELSLKKQNNALALNEKNLETIIQCTYDGIWDWHIQEDCEYFSSRFWEMLGYSPGEKKHHPSEWEKLIFPEDLKLLNRKYEDHIKSLGKDIFFQEVRFNHKNGKVIWVICRGQVVEWNGEIPIRMVGANTDVTELKEAQFSLQESSRLIALGEMAGGIAHEINNPLAIINSSAEVLMKSLIKSGHKSAMTTKLIDNILHTVSRISKIVEGLKKLSRQSSDSLVESARVHEVIMDSLSLCTEKFNSHGVELSINLYGNQLIQCRPIELSQVMINLLNNSYHAVKHRKDALVSIRVIDNEDEEELTIEIEDNGHGIPDAIKEKVMQPFFTTKAVGEGTGLGLSLSRKIIDSMGGRLRLGFSSPKGTCFCIDVKKTKRAKIGNKAS